jgi:Mg2+ and Co2+ transporter CorA
MPELDLPYGYQVTLVAIFLLCLTLYMRFKKLRWL